MHSSLKNSEEAPQPWNHSGQLQVSYCEIANRLDDFFLLALGQVIVKRQADDPFAYHFCHGTHPWFASESPSHVREMQRLIMKHAQDLERTELPNQRLPRLKAGHQHVEQMISLLILRRHCRQAHLLHPGPVLQM